MQISPVSNAKGDWLALIAGAMLPLAFAPFHFFIIALISLALLFRVWLSVSAKRAAWRGWLFGLGMYGVGVSWVYVSIHTYGGVPFAMAVFLTALFISFMALFPALLGYMLARFANRLSAGLLLVFVFPAAWVMQEWVRGWFLTGFPWLSAGYSQIDGPLVGYAAVAGVYGVSWFLALTAGLIVFFLLYRRVACRRGLISVCVAVAIWVVGYGLYRVDWVTTEPREISVALLQGNISQEMKWLPEVRRPTIDLYADMSRAHWGADLIVWPETALPDFYHRAEGFIQSFGEEARENNSDVLMGVLYIDKETQRYYNSMVSLGEEPAFYHKQHLVPFTEYLPLKWLLGGLVDFMNVPMSDFSAGSRDQPLLEGAGYKIGMSICYEDAFGEEVIWALPEASLLVNVSNDAWFSGSIAPHQHLQMAQMRAIESGRPMLRATNTGLTAAFDHKGRLLDSIPQYKVGVLKTTVQPMTGATPYAVMGNTFTILLAFLSLGCAALLHRQERRVK